MQINYKILMTTMAMEIGGAETHVLELCKAIKRQGADVFLVSNGGAYVQELEACGVKHYKAPLHNKKIKNIIASYYVLEKIITENQIRLVHAHARIPAFICGLLAKKLGFRLVTTVHFDFDVSFPWNILSRWGEKSLAVSEDLKQYLISNYKVPTENIFMTINGIDTSKFLPPSQPATANIVIHVGRMDKKANRTAYKIMDAMTIVRREVPDAALIIVGGGNDDENIAKQVKAHNAKSDSPFITAVGRRTDVIEFLRQGKVFVGISRAAMEAMATGLPVVLAGDYGAIGVFDETSLPRCVQTNFTCRGCSEPTVAQLAQDIKTLLEMPDDKRSALGDYGRRIVQEKYSVERMCKDALDLYEMVRFSAKPVDAVISGYYGFNNNGDDIVLHSIVEGLKEARPNIQITVLTKKPKETKAAYHVDVVNRFNFIAVYLLLKKSKMLITGGGSLIQDGTSTKSLIYYLWLINRAWAAGAKNMLFANGIGPVRRSHNVERVKNTLNRVDLITLRDELSLKTLTYFGVNRPEIHVTADAAYSMKPVDFAPAREKLRSIGLGERKYFGIAVRNWKYNKVGFEQEVAEFADYIQKRYQYAALFIAMRPVEDAEISKRIIGLMKSPGLFLGEKYTTDQIIGAVCMAEFLLGMRLHTLIYAAKSGTPAIGLVYESKVKVIMDALGQPYYRPVEDFTGQELCEYADSIMANKDKVSARLLAAGEQAREMARENMKLCLDLLDRPLF